MLKQRSPRTRINDFAWVNDAEETLLPLLISGWTSNDYTVAKDRVHVLAVARMEYVIGMLRFYFPIGVVDLVHSFCTTVTMNGSYVGWYGVGAKVCKFASGSEFWWWLLVAYCKCRCGTSIYD